MRTILCLSLAASSFLVGCSSGPTDLTKEYRAALADRPGVALVDNASGKRAAEPFAVLYRDLSVKNVTAMVGQVYATDAWFNDTIATEVGLKAIEEYLLKTAAAAQSVEARVQDVSVSGADCYVRWTMEVRTKNLAGGQPLLTEGITQLRFDEEGRVILHQDFWNPSAGIYQHLPLLGPAIRFVNGLIVGK